MRRLNSIMCEYSACRSSAPTPFLPSGRWSEAGQSSWPKPLQLEIPATLRAATRFKSACK